MTRRDNGMLICSFLLLAGFSFLVALAQVTLTAIEVRNMQRTRYVVSCVNYKQE